MAQRQFRSDDTSKWGLSFGAGSAGAKTYSAGHTMDAGDGYYYQTFTGSASATTGTTGLGTATYNLPCIIHQTQGTGAGNWELNYLVSVSSGTATLLYPLINTYATGAQIVTTNPFSTITVNSGITVAAPAWNGSYGGILFLMASSSLTNSGTLSASYVGFRGGDGSSSGSRQGRQGEGYTSAGGASTAANTTGGGGGVPDTASNDGGGGGSGGSHATAGTSGGTKNNGGPGTPATTIVGNASLTSMFFGGGGGEGGSDDGGSGGAGGIGGGIAFILSRTITNNGAINAIGQDGQRTTTSQAGGDAGGAGGSVLLKGQIISGSGSITATGGAGEALGQGGASAAGGNGGTGRAHIDYGVSNSLTSSPTLNSTHDATLLDTGGAFLFNVL